MNVPVSLLGSSRAVRWSWGLATWPGDAPRIEEGTLVRVLRDGKDRAHLFLEIESGGQRRTCSVAVSDAVKAQKLYDLLRVQGIGKDLRDILGWPVPA